MFNFCAAPFMHLYIRHKEFATICCVADNDFVDISKLDIDDHHMEEVWNSPYMKNLRLQLINNEAPDACHVCASQEKLGNIHVVKAGFNSNIKDRDLLLRVREAKNNNGELNKFPKNIGWDASKTCNLNCVICSPYNSTMWQRNADIRYEIDGYNKKNAPPKDTNIESIRKFVPYIKDLYIAGGEPTISVDSLKLLQYCIDYDYAKNMSVSFNTNFTCYNPKFVELISQFKSCHLNLSLDGHGAINEWVRVPSKWAVIEDNFNKWKNEPKLSNVQLIITAAVSIYSIMYLPRLFNWRNNSDNTLVNSTCITLNTVYGPGFLNPYNLPKDLKDEFNKNMLELKFLNLFETRKTLSYIKEINNSSPVYKDYYLWLAKLRRYTKNIDERFNLDSKKTFSELIFLHENND